MGRYYSNKKDVAEDYLKLSISELSRLGCLKGAYSGTIRWTDTAGHESKVGIVANLLATDMYIQLKYTHTSYGGQPEALDYKVPLTATDCNFGGERYWFLCPATKYGRPCGRRVQKLYGGKYFACRHCHDLSYSSRNEAARFRGYPFNALVIDYKLEELYKRLKRKYYAGKPTRTYQRILDLENRLGATSSVQ